MFKISAETEYAYVALLRLAQDYGRKPSTKLSEIVAERGLSEKFMLQVLTDLRRAGLVQSRRGKNGGYALARDPGEISLGDLFSVTTGEEDPNGSAFEIAGRDSFLAGIWRSILGELHSSAREATLSEAVAVESREKAPMYYI